MKRFTILSLLVIAVFLLAFPALANEDRDFCEEMLNEMTDLVEEEGAVVLDSSIDYVTPDTVMIYTVEFDPGDYAVFAVSGLNFGDIQANVYYEDEYNDGEEPFTTGEHEGDPTFSAVGFSLSRSDTLIIEIVPDDFVRGEDRGYFCILICEIPQAQGKTL